MNYFRCGGGRSTHTATKIDVAKTPLATFESNASGLYLPEILAYFSATQSGTGDPSPSNPRAISGVDSIKAIGAGTNILGGSSLLANCQVYISTGVTDLVNKTFSYGAGESVTNDVGGFSGSLSSKFKENTSYTIIIVASKSNTNASLNMRVRYTDGTNLDFSIPETVVAGQKYTCIFRTSNQKTILDIRESNVSGTTTVYYDECGVFEGYFTEDDFVSYTGTTATTALGGTYYGGYLNVTTGLLTVTSLLTTYDKNSSWTRNTSGIFYTNAPDGIDDLYISNMFECFLPKGSSNALADGQCRLNVVSTYINFKVTSCDTVDDFKAFLGDNTIQMVYTLATPQTYQLTPAQLEQLLGQNNVFCSSGDVAVKYWKID